ncbi:hypothetical protein ABTG41_13030, partial [Acinetobacter baumannii]
ITKNSRKQDPDIQQILKDTRELLLESDTVQERLMPLLMKQFSETWKLVEYIAEVLFREDKVQKLV